MKPYLLILIVLVLLLIGAEKEFFESIRNFWEIKATDVLLALFTYLLWKSTADLVARADINAERQVRAYLSLDNGDISIVNNKPRYSITYKNFGVTPAYNVQGALKFCLLIHTFQANKLI